MNPTGPTGVLLMYKESEAKLARIDQTVQEWILAHLGAQPEAAAAGGERTRAATGAVNLDWESLLMENAPLAFRVARGVLRNDADAEDVAQEALLRAYQKLDRLRDRKQFRAWLVRITFRRALDRLRAIKRRQLRESEWVFENARNERHAGESMEFQRQFDRAMEELPEKQRLVLLLTAMEGHSLDEVSALLTVPLGTVKSRLFFARKNLAERLRCFVNRTARS